jgi:hypothetical protein
MAEYEGKNGLIGNDDDSIRKMNDARIDAMFKDSELPKFDSSEDELQMPVFNVDITQLNNRAKAAAETIVKKLSDYYFNPLYVKDHPYIKNKISQEIMSISRLLKMISVNETAQDILIQSAPMHSGKTAIYSSLTTLQNTMLSIQNKIDSATEKLESIFKEMQDNADETFMDKSKEMDDNGDMVTRGSREFLKELTARINGEEYIPSDETVNGDIEYDAEVDE